MKNIYFFRWTFIRYTRVSVYINISGSQCSEQTEVWSYIQSSSNYIPILKSRTVNTYTKWEYSLRLDFEHMIYNEFVMLKFSIIYIYIYMCDFFKKNLIFLGFLVSWTFIYLCGRIDTCLAQVRIIFQKTNTNKKNLDLECSYNYQWKWTNVTW